MQKNISLKKALMYAFAFSVSLFWELFLCLVKNEEFFDIFVSAVLPIYMAAVVLILYPIFRYINSAFWFFPLFILGVCVIIGLPTFILVGLKCENFGIGTGLAYIIYGYILAVVLISLCVFDVLITALVRIVKNAKHREN